MKPNPIFSLPSAAFSIAFVLLILTACSKQNQEPQWQKFQPAGGRFVVELPGVPISEPPKTNDTEVVIKWHILSTLSNISGLSLAYSEHSTSSNLAPAKLLQRVRDNSISDLSGELKNEREITLKDAQGKEYPGLELQIAYKGGFLVRERIYLVGSRIYALMVISGSQGIFSNDAERFFKTFQIVP